MKKILGLFIFFIFICTKTFGAGIEIEPTMLSKPLGENRVWVGTFQLVWNDFIDKFVHTAVRFKNGTPEMVWQLNARDFSTSDISDDSYYKYAGRVNKNTKTHIVKAIKNKFNETSDILDKLDLTPDYNKFLIYAMLKKDFEFIKEFDKLGESDFGEGQSAKYFGIDRKSGDALDKGVTVLFYNDENDYAVKLLTKDKDEVYLYKTSANKPFRQLYADMNAKNRAFKGETSFKRIDELKVPELKFFKEKNFEELQNKRVLGTNLVIDKAVETVKFEMNNKGVKLKSEAAMIMMGSAFNPNPEVPRLFYFDDTFVLFLKETGKKSPYFALRVHDISDFR